MIRKHSRRFLWFGFLTCSFGALLLGLVAKFWLWDWTDTKQSITSETLIVLQPGTNLSTLASHLQKTGVIDDGLRFTLFVRMQRSYQKFQAGRYRFYGPVSPKEVIEHFVNGKIHHQLTLQVTLAEGLSMIDALRRLATHPKVDLDELTTLASDPSFAGELGLSANTLEGYIYPATYSFYDSIPSARHLLETTVKKFFAVIADDYHSHLAHLGLSLHQAVIIGSLIEKETSHVDEKPMIAEVILTRMKRGIPLGIDAALIYGIPNFDGDIKTKHLKDRRNPYNTRIHKGLPPGPICSPSRSSLAAVIQPTQLGYLFYVAKPRSDRHHFSKNLREHRIHVRKLVQQTRSR